ncbi:HET-domain-containing protein [Apiospora phragmitis]|uniref:HET-domain-containing protein n=1 Tax=Apiospora phragmitis TaxID=2905665 RepID=A0ABR1WW57_9PEZI
MASGFAESQTQNAARTSYPNHTYMSIWADNGNLPSWAQKVQKSHIRTPFFCKATGCGENTAHSATAEAHRIHRRFLPPKKQSKIVSTGSTLATYQKPFKQGDKDDWASEAGRMGTVYENDALVIAASGSAIAQGGCFVTGSRRLSTIDLPYYTEDGDIQGVVHACAHAPGRANVPMWGPLQQRGWALQEAYFARRSIHFMPGSPTCYCREACLNERNNTGNHQKTPPWDWLIEEFSRRRLTYKSDRLMAMQRLLWVNYDPPTSEDLAQDLVELPSWTWASRGGRKSFLLERDFISEMEPVLTHNKFQVEESSALTAEGMRDHVL